MSYKFNGILFSLALALASCGSSAGDEPEQPKEPDQPQEEILSDTVLADCKLASSVLGGQQPYTVYIPENWDETKT